MNIGFDRIGSAFGSLKLRITPGGIVALKLGIVLNTVFLTGTAEPDTLNARRSREQVNRCEPHGCSVNASAS